MGTKYVCEYCYTGYNHILGHFWPIAPCVCSLRAARMSFLLLSVQTAIAPVGLRFASRPIKNLFRGLKDSPAAVSFTGNVSIAPFFITYHQKVKLIIALRYMQVLERETKHNKLIFFDFEALVNDHSENFPYLVCTKTSDAKCWSSQGEDCAEKFLAYFRRPLFIAHNAKGFDDYIILRVMVKQGLNHARIESDQLYRHRL